MTAERPVLAGDGDSAFRTQKVGDQPPSSFEMRELVETPSHALRTRLLQDVDGT